jgi:hypothetical protein
VKILGDFVPANGHTSAEDGVQQRRPQRIVAGERPRFSLSSRQRGEGSTDLAHPVIGHPAKAFDEKRDRDAFDRVQVDR